MTKYKFRAGHRTLLLAGLIAFAAILLPSTYVAAESPTNGGVATLRNLGNTFSNIAEQASPAVVFIEVSKEMPQRMSPRGGLPPGPHSEFFRRFFGPGFPEFDMGPGPGTGPAPGPQRFGQGSGFLISSDGYIVTNHHVVGDADVVTVTLRDGKQLDASIVGTDPNTEIALIKIEGNDFPHLRLANSDDIRVGEWVIAIGSPFGLNHSVTAGIVSARGRSNVGIVDYADFIQTDAAINPGNSGGPLLNLDGDVIGVNTAIYSRTGGYMGIGFAIPSNMTRFVADQLRDSGAIVRGYLGIGIENLNAELAEWFGLANTNGILVSEVAPDSPAEKGGIRRDDVIVEFGGQPVTEAGAFRSRVASTPAGSSIPLVVLRDGKRVALDVTVGALDGDQVATQSPDGDPTPNNLGLAVEPLTPDLARRYGYVRQQGVLIAEVQQNSAAALAGLQPGMLIREVNRRPIRNPRDFREALRRGDKRSTLLLVQDGERARYVTLVTR